MTPVPLCMRLVSVFVHVCRCFRLFTDPIKTLRAPSGVTRIGGAKAYAAKLATSPMTTGQCEQVGKRAEDGRGRTCDDAGPPNGTLEICEAISFKAMLLTCLHQAFFRNDKTRSLYSLAREFAGLEVRRIYLSQVLRRRPMPVRYT